MEPGDVVIILAEQPHEKFSRRGDHLVYNMKITISEALCGFDHVIKHLDGRSVVLSRPPGKVMEPNGLYMIAGEGMPKYGMSDPDAKGDLYVTCDIVFPENIETAEVCENYASFLPSKFGWRCDPERSYTVVVLFNCSQTKLVAIILVPLAFFKCGSSLDRFFVTHLNFCPQKRDKQVAPSGH